MTGVGNESMKRLSSLSLGILGLLLGCTAIPKHEIPASRQLAQTHQEAQKTRVCEVHHITMQNKAVPIIWGQAVPPGSGDPPYHYRMQHSPNYIEVIEGGCSRIPGKTSQMTLICARCQNEAMEWRKGRK
jgi:hypothetical protein